MTRSADSGGTAARPATGTDGRLQCIVVDYDTPGMARRFVRSAAAAGLPRERILVVQNHLPALAETRRLVAGAARVVAGRPNFGYAAGVNTGLALVRAEWYLVANSDVIVDRAAIDALLACGDAHPRCAIAGGRLVGERGNPLPSVLREHSVADVIGSLLPPGLRLPRAARRALSAYAESAGGIVPAVVGAALLVRDRAVSQAGPMDEQYVMFCEEVDWARRFRNADWEIRYCPTATIIHTGSVSIARDRERHEMQLVISKMQYIKQHRGLLHYCAARCAVLAAVPLFLLSAAATGKKGRCDSHETYRRLIRTIAGLPW